jgi:hypothetical protein
VLTEMIELRQQVDQLRDRVESLLPIKHEEPPAPQSPGHRARTRRSKVVAA